MRTLSALTLAVALGLAAVPAAAQPAQKIVFDTDFALTSATVSGGPLSSERPEPTVKWVTIAIACSATDTPIATLMADTRRAGAIDSGGMRAGGSAPATESRAVRGVAATFPPGAGGAIALAPCAGGAPARTATSAGAAG